MSRGRKCGRNPNLGPGSCKAWWASCQAWKTPPEGCIVLWSIAFNKADVYAWKAPWRNPITGEVYPPPPALPPIEPRQLTDARIRELISVSPDNALVEQLRAERRRRQEANAA